MDVSSSEPAANDLQTVVRAWAEQQFAANPSQRELYQAFLDQAEPPLLDTILNRTLRNHSAAADILGIHRATLRKKLCERGGR
jgi:DNA-binding protein Fis